MFLRRAAAVILLLFVPAMALAQERGQQPSQQPQPSLPRPEVDQGCTIGGRVLYAEDFTPAEGIMVRLLDRGVPRDQVFTSSGGRFRFRALPQGQFDVEVSLEGRKPTRVSVDLSFLCRNETTTILLERETVVVTYTAPGASVSARELQIPKDARKAYEKGLRELEEKNRPELSLGHFQKAIELYPDYDIAYLQLALAHLALQQNAEAQRVLEGATSVNGENARAFLLLGMVHGKQGHANESVRALKTAVGLDERDWLAHFELGRTLLANGLSRDAHTHAQRAHELSPQNRNVHLLLHDTCMQVQDYETALAEVDEFLELFPDDPLVPRLRRHGDELRKALRAKAQ